MGNQNGKVKKSKDLQDLAKVSNPIMPTTGGRVCTIEDGKVVLNFRHHKEDYNNLNSHLEKIKNKMDLIITDDLIEILKMRFENLKNVTLNEEIKPSIESFSSTYKTDLNNYYNLLIEIKKVYKETYIMIATFLSNWLKVQTKIETDGETAKLEELEKKIDNLKINFNNFKDIEEIINKICYFKLNYNNVDKINELNQYFEENKDEIKKNYNFENAAQFRSLINLRDQIIDAIKQKNNFIDILDDFHKEYLNIYKIVLKQINSTNLEKVEIANELNEYNGVVIYHRLIRSIEERIKKLNI